MGLPAYGRPFFMFLQSRSACASHKICMENAPPHRAAAHFSDFPASLLPYAVARDICHFPNNLFQSLVNFSMPCVVSSWERSKLFQSASRSSSSYGNGFKSPAS